MRRLATPRPEPPAITVNDICTCGSWRACDACGQEFKLEGWEVTDHVAPGQYAVGIVDFRTGRIPIRRASLCGTCAPTEDRARELAGDALAFLREQLGWLRGWWKWRRLGRPETIADYRRVLGIDPLGGWPGLPLPIPPPSMDKGGHNEPPSTPRQALAPVGHWGRSAVLTGAEREALRRDPSPELKIEDLHGLSYRTTNAIRLAGVATLGDLITKRSRELRNVTGIGPVSMREIHEDLQRRGLKLRED